jgi:hypothetical protein
MLGPNRNGEIQVTDPRDGFVRTQNSMPTSREMSEDDLLPPFSL